MIITKTPFRMSFFGGGSDFVEHYRQHGAAVISSTFDKYCYVTLRNLPPFFDYKTHLSYSKDEFVNSNLEIEHPLIREALKWLEVDQIRLVYDADLPARTGLGTSSSFAVGLLKALYELRGDGEKSSRALADDAIYLERNLCAEAGGVQDQIAAAFGGFNRIDFSDKGYCVTPIAFPNARKKELEGKLLLFFIGFTRFSADIQKGMSQSLGSKANQLIEMSALVNDVDALLKSPHSCLDDFGRLLDHAWRLKRDISTNISTDYIDSLYQRALSAGALGGKLLGAGGGGFLLFYADEERQSTLESELSELLRIPFSFEDEGVKTIYSDFKHGTGVLSD